MMRRLAGAVVWVMAAGIAVAGSGDPARFVDPFIGTGGHGHTYPGATLPFGMVQLSPDTRLTGWDGCSGYHASDTIVYGFSHTHLSGTGVSDYGDVLLMPTTGPVQILNGAADGPDSGYASRFRKAAEQAAPGYYRVHLDDYGVEVELTATERTGLHRYRFPPGKAAQVIIDLTHRDEVLSSELRIVGPTEVEGFRRSTAWARDQRVYFVARFSRPMDRARVYRDLQPLDEPHADGRDVRAALSFGAAGGELLVQVGISAVDVEGARRNLDREHAGWDFDEARRAARRRWNEALGRVAIDGGDPGQRTVFYTALYHSLIAPNVFSDVDGRYRGMDGLVHRAEDRRHYTVFSLWDTFRATHPLFTILEPRRTGEFIRTFLAQYEQGGRLPVWELAGNETDCMIGYHAVSVIADAHVKGIVDFDAAQALSAMVDSATRDHFGLDAYQRQGFIGIHDEPESVSKTLEYAYDDWCIAGMAERLGRDDIARQFYARSESWRHLFDRETGFFRPRADQRWLEPFDPFRVDNHFTEANAWQYSLFVPHNIEGLIEAHGGEAAFTAHLDRLFEADPQTTGRDQADISGQIGQYAHGNEPSHHVAWLYHYVGRPDRTADRVRRILSEMYAPTIDGLSGNEDCGQMSSWYVLAALGIYPVVPGSDQYVLTAPLFNTSRLTLENGKRLTLTTTGKGPYIAAVRHDGRLVERSYLTHAELMAGGRIEIALTPRPDPDWGRKPEARPRSPGSPETVIPAPLVARGEAVFRGQTEIVLTAPGADTIRYTFDPAGPESGWSVYETPLPLDRSDTLHFVAIQGARRSPVVRARFHRIPNDWQVETDAEPAPEYAENGAVSLIDGRRGQLNWRTGGWLGYRTVDLTATVDLGAVRPLSRIGAGFLQDVKSWIWMPRDLVIEVSDDGQAFRRVARLENPVADDDPEVRMADWIAPMDGVAARWVRFRVRNLGTIPDWHPGHGEGAWIFVDEIIVE